MVAIPFVLMAALLGAVAVVNLVFEPLERRSGRIVGPRFGVGDLCCLMFVLQATIAPWWIGFREQATITGMVLSIGFIWLLFALGWLGGVTSLSRAGITSTWRRGVTLCLVVPLTYICATSVFLCVVLGSVFFLLALIEDGNFYAFAITFLSSLVTLLVVWGLRGITTWAAAASPYSRSTDKRLSDKLWDLLTPRSP